MNEKDLEERIQELEKQVKRNTTICNIVEYIWIIGFAVGGIALIWYLLF